MSWQAPVEAGQRWRHKRDSYRYVDVIEVRAIENGPTYVYVRRSTSRRGQPIRIDTLRRDYYPTRVR